MNGVLVVMGGECDRAPGSMCVVAVIDATKTQARLIAASLGPGEIAHWMSVSPASDYLPAEEAPR